MRPGELERRLQERLDALGPNGFSGPFDEVFRTEGVEIVKTPIRSPHANAFAERWVRTVREECLDHVLVFGRGHLQAVLREYAAHYNGGLPPARLRSSLPTHPVMPGPRRSPSTSVAGTP